MSKLPPSSPEHEIVSIDSKSYEEDDREDILFLFPFFYNQQNMMNQVFQYIGTSVVEQNKISLGERILKLKRITQVTRVDIAKLDEDKQFNSVIINFWMNWLIMNTNDYFRHKTLYINTYFFQGVL